MLCSIFLLNLEKSHKYIRFACLHVIFSETKSALFDVEEETQMK